MSDVDAFVKWFDVAFLLAGGGFLWFTGRKMLTAGALVLCRSVPSEDRERVEAAVERREALEALPNAGPVYGVSGLALAGAVAANVLTPGMGYALFVLVLATALMWMYAHIRRPATAPRAAVLAPRSAWTAPPLCYAAAVGTICCLLLGREGHLTLGDVLVIIAACGMFAFALLMGRLPALLTGVDPSAELYVDERLRRKRALAMLYYVCATMFVYETWELAHVPGTASHVARAAVFLMWFPILIYAIVEARAVVEMREATA